MVIGPALDTKHVLRWRMMHNMDDWLVNILTSAMDKNAHVVASC